MSFQSFQSRLKFLRQKIWLVPLAALVCIAILLLSQIYVLRRFEYPRSFSFTYMINETDTEELIVPNIVHFIVIEDSNISFIHFVCILAAMRNQKPEKIYFHTNVDTFTGLYWTRLMNLKPFTDILEIRPIAMPIQKDMQISQDDDLTRIRMLMEYGGIYLDNDSYIVKSLDYYRKFEMSVGWDEGESLGTQIIVAHKDASFLYVWLHTYDGGYYTNRWYFSAGEFPTTSVLSQHPSLVHRVKLLFGNKTSFLFKLFQEYWPEWKKNYAFHLFAREKHQRGLQSISKDATYPVDFDEYNLQKYPITFREMTNEVLSFEESLRSSVNKI